MHLGEMHLVVAVILHPVGGPFFTITFFYMHSTLIIRQRLAKEVVKIEQDKRDVRLIRPLGFFVISTGLEGLLSSSGANSSL
jgi:hypothetical protein